jgi:hypothetical protein
VDLHHLLFAGFDRRTILQESERMPRIRQIG